MTRRNRSQMTLEAFEEEQQSLDDIAESDTAPTPRLVDEDTTSTVVRRFGLEDDTTPAVAPRGALETLRAMEGAA